MRLHLGCGDVFLTGPGSDWINVDLFIPSYSFLAKDRPDLVEQNRTSLDRYYKHDYTRYSTVSRLCVADWFMDARRLEVPDHSVEQIVAVQLIEHFTPAEAISALKSWYKALKVGGVFLVDTLDLSALFREWEWKFGNPQEDEYYLRMIYGSQKNELACHRSGYYPAKLREMLVGTGFSVVRELENPLGHPYSMSLTFEAVK